MRNLRTFIGLRLGVLLPLLAASPGCKLVAFPHLMWSQEPTRTIPADYPYLVDKSVCLVVRAEMETLVEYPHVQFEVADHVQTTLTTHVAGVKVVDARKVVDYQRQRADWEKMDPADLGQHFDAQRLIEIELTQYTTREPESPYLHRGYITATLNVYNTDFPDSAPAISMEVHTVFPPDGPGEWGTSDSDIRRAAMEAFAEQVAGKFYDRKVKVE